MLDMLVKLVGVCVTGVREGKRRSRWDTVTDSAQPDTSDDASKKQRLLVNSSDPNMQQQGMEGLYAPAQALPNAQTAASLGSAFGWRGNTKQ
mmetsp:Transcript_15118/g.24050  ORF Transcript_15118/g.24050 Transcript_15118/m.24050 type:complete len:92 (-) Transcript_15118:663-938(-)